MISAAIVYFESFLFKWRDAITNAAMWPCAGYPSSGLVPFGIVTGDSSGSDGDGSGGGCAGDETPRRGDAFGAFLGYNCGLVLLAALCTFGAPKAAGSGLAQVKAYLNGTGVRENLRLSTLVAKVVGITLIVSTGLPLGKEGPMVHTGAIVASGLSRVIVPWTRGLLELRLPSSQREWVGMGCAAGVAAAFNAPLGGILYSFEEVCSSWSESLTWRAFVGSMLAAITFNWIVNNAFSDVTVNGILIKDGFAIGIDSEEANHTFEVLDYVWCIVLGILGGILGALYNRLVIFFARLRRRALKSRPRTKVLEAVAVAAIVFTAYFWTPDIFECRKCTEGMNCYDGAGSSGSDDGDGGDRRRRLAGGGGGLHYVQWTCAPHYYSELATLFHSGQEGLIKHLFERATASSDGDEGWEIRSPVLAVFLAFYFPLAAFAFGIAVPAGNFIPAMTVGAALGRLVGQELNGAEGAATSIVDAGKFAMLGSAAMLGGVTRMTLTLAVILVEVTKDVYAVVPIMITLACAKAVGDLFSPSFDHGMIHFNHLPFLEEEPPQEWEVLTARDVMAKHVIVLREIETVGDLVVLLRKTRHNGFPIVDTGRHGRCTFFNGLILRRQLLVVLSHRVWELQRDAPNAPLPLEIQRAFVGSDFTKIDERKLSRSITEKDREATLDLRPFMDPSPYVVNELMPLRRVYKLFNRVGVRHLVVVDCREMVVGIVTRKDVLPEIIEERLEREHSAELAAQLAATGEATEGDGSTAPDLSTVGASVSEGTASQGERKGSVAAQLVRGATSRLNALVSPPPTPKVPPPRSGELWARPGGTPGNPALRGRRGSSPLSGKSTDSPPLGGSPPNLSRRRQPQSSPVAVQLTRSGGIMAVGMSKSPSLLRITSGLGLTRRTDGRDRSSTRGSAASGGSVDASLRSPSPAGTDRSESMQSVGEESRDDGCGAPAAVRPPPTGGSRGSILRSPSSAPRTPSADGDIGMSSHV